MIPAMEDLTDHKLDIPGKRMRHTLTGLEIKLLSPNGKGWRAQVMRLGVPQDYVVNLTHEDLMRRFRDVDEE